MIDEKGARRLVGDIFGLSPIAIRPGVVKALERELSTLQPRERIVLELVYGLKGTRDHALREIAPLIAVSSRERVRQVKARALRRLKHPYHSTALRQYIAIDGALAELEKPTEPKTKRRTTKTEVKKEKDKVEQFKDAIYQHAQSIHNRLEELNRKPLLVTYFVEVLDKLDKILETLQSMEKKNGK